MCVMPYIGNILTVSFVIQTLEIIWQDSLRLKLSRWPFLNTPYKYSVGFRRYFNIIILSGLSFGVFFSINLVPGSNLVNLPFDYNKYHQYNEMVMFYGPLWIFLYKYLIRTVVRLFLN